MGAIGNLTVTFISTQWVAATSDDDGLVWGIYRAEDTQGRAVTIKGRLEPSAARTGLSLELAGQWVKDKRYGPQYEFKNYSRCQPNGRWGTVAFLMQAEGIGQTLGERIYDAYGEESIGSLIEDPETVVHRVPGLRVDVATEAAKTLAPLVNESKLKLPLLTLFKGTKLPRKTADRVLEARISDPVPKLSANPFLLMQFTGIGFKQCDSLRIKLKLPSDMPERIMAACLQSFSDESDQTWLTSKQITQSMCNLLEVKQLDATMSLNNLVRDNAVIQSERDDSYFALRANYESEKFVAAYLMQRMKQDPPQELIDRIEAIDTTQPGEITQHQKDVLLNNVRAGGRVLVLPGSPGTGKTYTLARLLSLFSDYHACAPTGKAAQRLSQSLRTSTATTIHRLLGPKPLSGGGFAFTYQNGEIKYGAIAVDESSMVNNDLAAALFRGLNASCYLILVGDQNQLPPVGPGTMLRDMQATGKFQELTEIQRNAGMIVRSCAAIREMRAPQLHMQQRPGTNVVEDRNVHLAMAGKDDRKMDWVQKIVDQIQDTGLSCKEGTTSSMHDIQFITATHRNPHIGREALNTYLQKRFNPSMQGDHKKFKVGDKVICTENCFLDAAGRKSDSKVFVANGDLGVVTNSMEKRIHVRITSTGEEVLAPCGEDGGGWDLGYCITTHKSQGSEWPIVVCCMGSDFGSEMVMSREWLYTAISRAKFCCIIICGPGQIAKQVKKVRIYDRVSAINHYWKQWEDAYNAQAETAEAQVGAGS